ncbi:MAG: hypothetical protein R3E73_09270 [Porticoccaceae bacterium]
MNSLFKERPLIGLLDELWPLVMEWPDSAMKRASHALFIQELARQLTRYHWSRHIPKKQLILVGSWPLLFRQALIAILAQHYLVMDLGENITASEIHLASQVLDGIPVLCGELESRRKEWHHIGPFMRFSEIEEYLRSEAAAI